MNDQHMTSRGRRRFLRQGVTAAGGGVLLLLTAQEGGTGQPQAGAAGENTTPDSQGYRVTDHIRDYYATLRS
jgi:hypothetical protein